MSKSTTRQPKRNNLVLETILEEPKKGNKAAITAILTITAIAVIFTHEELLDM